MDEQRQRWHIERQPLRLARPVQERLAHGLQFADSDLCGCDVARNLFRLWLAVELLAAPPQAPSRPSLAVPRHAPVPDSARPTPAQAKANRHSDTSSAAASF